MLELFRRHAFFLLVIALIIFVAFIWWGDANHGAAGGSVRAGKKSFDMREIQRISRSFQVAQTIGTDRSHVGLLVNLDRRFGDQQLLDYENNVLVLREHRQDLGIEPSEDQRREALAKLESIRGLGSGEELNKWLSNRNMTFSEVDDVMADVVSLNEIRELVGTGIRPSPLEVNQAFRDRYETRTARAFLIKKVDPADYTPTDQEIEEYWTGNRDSLLTAGQRSIRYARFNAPTVEELAQLVEAEQKQDAQKAFTQRVQNFFLGAAEKGSDFGEIASLQGVPLVTVGLFEEDTAPEDLPAQLVAPTFEISPSVPVSDPVKIGDDYVIFELLEEVVPVPLELDAARPQIIEILRNQKEGTLTLAAANEARAGLSSVLAKDGDLLAKAEELGLEAIDLGEYTPENPPADRRLGQLARDPKAQTLLSREVSEPIELGQMNEFFPLMGMEAFNGDYAVVAMERRELLPTTESEETRREQIQQQMEGGTGLTLLEAWFHPLKSDLLRNPALGAE